MILKNRRTLGLAGALGVGLGGVVGEACASREPERLSTTSDSGIDSSANDSGDTGTSEYDASTDAVVLVDASPEPIECSVTPCAVEIAAGAASACVRLQTGGVRCWGSDVGGALGRGTEAGSSNGTPAPVVGLDDATQISGSASVPGDVYCALRAEGTSVCWGSNTNGVLGRVSDEAVVLESSPTAAPVDGLRIARAIFAGYAVSCVALAGNDVACWGSNDAAQIPNGPREPGSAMPATTFALGAETKQLAIADRGTVALTGGGLLSWGERVGVLGREVSTDVDTPVKIELSHVSAVASSVGRACAIANGTVYCWGNRASGEHYSVYPRAAGVGSPTVYAQTLSVGWRFACATLSNGSAICWGDNSRGQLGAGTLDFQQTPVKVQKLAGKPVRMAVMDRAACALLRSGKVQCWGQNDEGQLGTGAIDSVPSLEPQNVVLAP